MKNEYVFPALFQMSDGINISFPDLPGCLSCADNLDEAVINAKEVLEGYLWGMEKDGESIPEPTPIDKIELQKYQIPILITVWMPVVRSEMENQLIKKTLTIPKWVNDLGEKNKVNFSQLLTQVLKEHLGIKR